MYHLITIGDVTVDIYFQGESLAISKNRFSLAVGGKYIVDRFYQGLGGGGANVAIGCAKAGLNTAVYAKVGENVFKQIIIQSLVRKTVSTEFLCYQRNFINLSAILLSSKGERTILHYPTPNTSLDTTEIIKKNLLKGEAVYIGHLPDIRISEKNKLISFFNSHNKLVFLNIGSGEIIRPQKEIIPYIQKADVLIINTHEYAELIRKPISRIRFDKDCSEHIGFKDKILVLTDGPNGSWAYSNGSVFREKAIKVANIKDTTGAGDSFTSGFISCYIKNRDIPSALESGTRFAAVTLKKIGAS